MASMPVMPSPGRPRWLRRGLVAVAVVVVGAGVAVAVVLLHAPGNVSHPSVEFTRPTAPTRRPVINNFEWPRYGFDAARTRYFAAKGLSPPLRVGWRYQDFALLEFPPVIYQNTLYLVDDNGWAKAINKITGHTQWAHKVGTLAAASPAFSIHDKLVFLPLLSDHGSTPGGGSLVALSMKTG